MNETYIVVYQDAKTGVRGQIRQPFHIRSAADAYAITLDLQYPSRDHQVLPQPEVEAYISRSAA